ncbi:unnamed protein product [Bursaphelenchus xylophilus]|uniref:(pine wood nematode) hypothetical protein n=1 Tax=Bursaphelenchus xylophilus TaxID=6326 RepID=A0A1I7SMJ0_BURXY|nr:unnamed protein product [Bursaphelenchus xylophilus]CAG9130242.1 unnamed protein product [Bursaphelenchus xylophilus]
MLNIPKELSPISPFIKIAHEHKTRDVTVYYWTLMHATKLAMDMRKDSVESKTYLLLLLDEMEDVKKQNPENESLKVDVIAQAYIEEQARKFFAFADGKDRNGEFNKNVVKAFYTAGYLFDVLAEFGELDEAIVNNRKYAKWKSTYIHNCLKNGETPVPGPPPRDEGEELANEFANIEFKPQPPPRTSPPASGVPQHPDSQGFGWNHLNSAGGNPASNQNNFSQPRNQFDNNQFYAPSGQANSSSIGQPFVPPANPSYQYNHDKPSYPPAVPPPSYVPSSFPYPPTQSFSSGVDSPSGQSNGSKVSLEDYIEARRLCKMACSALDYEDGKTAIDFMEKALKVLKK